MRPGARLVVGFVVSSLASAAAQSQDCTFLVPTGFPADEYAAIVGEYREGHHVDAGERLRDLGQERVGQVFAFLRRNGWSERCLLAAALLHTEAGMRAQKIFARRKEPQSDFELARKLTDLVRDQDTRNSFQRNWLLLMGLFYQKLMFDPDVQRGRTEVLSLASELFRGAEKHFDDAVKRFPRDSEILLVAGTLFEWSGAPGFGEPRHLAKAESLYERACRSNPDDAVAQLRYGTVLWKRRDFDKAGAPLRRVLEISRDDELLFRAHITIGRIAVREKEHQEAIAHFRMATEKKPDWQVAALALSYSLHAAGSRAESRQVLENALRLPRTNESRFGSWSYEAGLTERFDPLLESMRREVLF